MTHLERLRIVAERLLRDREDLRHTLLDVADEFLAATADVESYPEPVRVELADLRREVEAARPRFASHRRTSVLFDEAGLGRPGRERARALAGRIVAVARLLR